MPELNERQNILIVDDEPEITKALRRLFRKSYKVFTAHSGHEALEILQEHSIPVIISDQRMPGLTGSEFLSRVEKQYPDSTRLLVTGFADINAVIEAINTGRIFRYVTKPWDPEELIGIVAQAFERYELIIQNRSLVTDLKEANTGLEVKVRERTSDLQTANEELARLDALKNDFLNMAAHDLRNPLGAIMGFSNLILDSDPPEEKRRRMLTLIHQASATMLRLVNELLDISHIEQGRLEVHPERINYLAFLQYLQDLFEPLAAQKGIRLVTAMPETISQAFFDPIRIEQVLGNLLANAFKFSHSSTTVEVRSRRFDEVLEIEVIDQGQGIPTDELDKIFGQYEQSSTKAVRAERGIGLGLSICKQIIEDHGGEIGVESRLGEGSRFFFRLPGGAPQPTTGEAAPSADVPHREAADASKFHVLVVDDMKFARMLMERHLSDQGHRVSTVESGPEALEYVKQQHPDLILMDVEMPELDGRETTQRLREFSTAVVIGVTGHNDSRELERCLSAGMNEVLVKPISPEVLRSLVRRWCSSVQVSG
jgi:signal transduction histidine kinase